MEKHIGFYLDIQKFEADKGNLAEPWVAYIGEGDSFEVKYSSETTLGHNANNIAADLNQKIDKLKNSFITLTEDEYEKLVNNPGIEIEISPLGSDKMLHKYDASVFYYTYDPKDLPTEE